MPVYKMQPTLGGQGGTSVVANPTLAGTEPDLTGLEVEGTKYKVPQGGGGTDLGAQFQPNQKILEFLNKALQLDANLDFKQTFFDTAKFKQALVKAGVDMSVKLFDNDDNLCFELVIPNKSMTDQSGGDGYLEVFDEIYEFEFVNGTGSGAGNIYLKEEIDWQLAEGTGIIIPKSELPDNPTLGDALDYLISNDIAIKSSYKNIGENYVVPYKAEAGLYNIPEFTTCMIYEGYGNSSQAFMAKDENFKGYALLDDLTDAIFVEE